MSKTINLGRVTAYADAVAAGYTGTREEFAHDLANAANYAAEAGDAAETASEAATTASTAAETATTKAEEASEDADQAHADAQAILGAKDTALEAAATASSKAGEAANSAQQAAASETAAAGSATAASNAATSATASKNAAATSETNAANSANAAAQTLTNVNQAGATQVAAIQAKGTEVLNSIPADYTTLSNDVDDLKSDFDAFVTQEKAIDFSELTYDRVSINQNYNWNPSAGSNLGSSYIIPLTDADKIFIVKNNNESLAAQVSFLRTYDPSALRGPVDGYGLVTIPAGETVTLIRPSDALYFYVYRSASTGIVRTPDVTIEYQLYVTPDVYKADKAIIDGHVLGNKTYTQYRGTNASGEFSYQSAKRGNTIKFRCNFSVLGELTIGYKNVNDVFSTYVIIDVDNIRIKVPNVTEISAPHGLTITNEYTVTIYNDIEKIYITLESSGNAYTYNRVWTAGYLKPAYSLTESTFTSVDFTFSNVDISREIWMFGDSYFSYGENRWVYYLVMENNSNNCMIDAYAGEGSERAINSFDYLTSIATPKYLIWALGMNDGSDGENPDTTWKTDLEHVLEVCKEKGITPVLCTIPTVSIKNHEKKNEYVRNSGHLYIDFAQAVGADANGNWYSGMLSSDGIHPTIVGAKTLYQQALADFPIFTYK